MNDGSYSNVSWMYVAQVAGAVDDRAVRRERLLGDRRAARAPCSPSGTYCELPANGRTARASAPRSSLRRATPRPPTARPARGTSAGRDDDLALGVQLERRRGCGARRSAAPGCRTRRCARRARRARASPTPRPPRRPAAPSGAAAGRRRCSRRPSAARTRTSCGARRGSAPACRAGVIADRPRTTVGFTGVANHVSTTSVAERLDRGDAPRRRRRARRRRRRCRRGRRPPAAPRSSRSPPRARPAG